MTEREIRKYLEQLKEVTAKLSQAMETDRHYYVISAVDSHGGKLEQAVEIMRSIDYAYHCDFTNRNN